MVNCCACCYTRQRSSHLRTRPSPRPARIVSRCLDNLHPFFVFYFFSPPPPPAPSPTPAAPPHDTPRPASPVCFTYSPSLLLPLHGDCSTSEQGPAQGPRGADPDTVSSPLPALRPPARQLITRIARRTAAANSRGPAWGSAARASPTFQPPRGAQQQQQPPAHAAQGQGQGFPPLAAQAGSAPQQQQQNGGAPRSRVLQALSGLTVRFIRLTNPLRSSCRGGLRRLSFSRIICGAIRHSLSYHSSPLSTFPLSSLLVSSRVVAVADLRSCLGHHGNLDHQIWAAPRGRCRVCFLSSRDFSYFSFRRRRGHYSEGRQRSHLRGRTAPRNLLRVSN